MEQIYDIVSTGYIKVGPSVLTRKIWFAHWLNWLPALFIYHVFQNTMPDNVSALIVENIKADIPPLFFSISPFKQLLSRIIYLIQHLYFKLAIYLLIFLNEKWQAKHLFWWPKKLTAHQKIFTSGHL